MFDCDSNERIVEGSSTPDHDGHTMAPDDVESGLWGLRITIERLDLIPEDFSNVFCQFSLFGRCEESWSTEPIQISQGSADVATSWELAVKAGPELVKVGKLNNYKFDAYFGSQEDAFMTIQSEKIFFLYILGHFWAKFEIQRLISSKTL